MHKNYTKGNIISLLVVIASIFFLILLFDDSETIVEFADSGLEEAVREAIEKDEGTIYLKDVNTLQELDAANYQIEKLDGIEHLIELRDLNLEDNFIQSVSPIKNLTKLQKLSLRNNEIISLEAINFQDILYLGIRDISLRHNVKRDQVGNSERLSDITLLHQMVSLRKLELRDNHIKDLTPISDLRRLTELDIRENKFETIEPLETLTRLKKLNLRDNKTESLEPLRYLTDLSYLNIHSNTHLDSLEPIGGLVNLETLIMRNVEIKEASFLEKLTQLQNINGIDTGIEKIDDQLVEKLLKKGALQGDVRPVRMLQTLDAPEFSQESGFYEEDFLLDISSSELDQEIYYTLDGSEPDLNSNVYRESIDIQQLGDNQATVVRAKHLSPDNMQSETITKTYFVDGAIKERFDLPIFSLVTDPDNLFDETIGIYAENNYENRGTEWERPVHVEYIGSNGNLAFAQNAGIRIHGGMTRVAPQKSLRLYADSKYDEEEMFNYPFFENSDMSHFKRLILRNSGNDRSQTMFNDALMQSLVYPIGTVDTQAYQPAVIFINGDYHGLLNIRERMDEYYLSTHYDIDKDDIVILENNAAVYRGGNKDVYHYLNMIKYIETHGVSDDKHLGIIETMMDFENYIDYFATEIYFGNADWPGNNIKYWRKTTEKYDENTPYGHDGRWRWMLFDTDFGFYRSDDPWGDQKQPINHKHNTIRWVMTEFDGVRGNQTWPNFLFRELMQNEQFKKQFLIRFNDLVNSYLGENIAVVRIDEMKNKINKEVPYQISRWGNIESMEVWQDYIDKKYRFAKERPSYIRNYMMEEFDLEDVITISISNETNQGYVKLNSIGINSELPGNNPNEAWSGDYFKNLPITLEAIAKEGYEFSHWENIDSIEHILEITPDKDIEIKAVFKEY